MAGDGSATLFANNLPIDPMAVVTDSSGDVYFTSPSGIFRIYPEAESGCALPEGDSLPWWANIRIGLSHLGDWSIDQQNRDARALRLRMSLAYEHRG